MCKLPVQKMKIVSFFKFFFIIIILCDANLSKDLKLKLQLRRGEWVEVRREVCGLCLGFRSNRWNKEFHYWYFSLFS
jgi:hypothetical protein